MKKIIRKVIIGIILISIAISIILVAVLLPLSSTVKILRINTDEDFVKHDFSGSGTKQDPYLIKNLELGVTEYEVDDFYTIISVSNTTKHFVIQYCILSGGAKSIHLKNVGKGTVKIIGNTMIAREFCVDDICSTTAVGVELENTSGVEIRDNVLLGQEIVKTWSHGEYIDYDEFSRGFHLKNSSNNLIENNYIRDTGIPIDCLNSINITVEKNSFIFDNHAGLWIINCSLVSIRDNSFEGYVFDCIYVSYSVNIMITNNTFITGGASTAIRLNYSNYLFINNNIILVYHTGIRITYCTEILISYNLIKSCNSFAIDLFVDVLQAIIFHNTFLYNNFKMTGESQCNDNCFNNTWYNEYISEGNFWSDLGSSSTYTIGGSAGSVDLYPLSSPLFLDTY